MYQTYIQTLVSLMSSGNQITVKKKKKKKKKKKLIKILFNINKNNLIINFLYLILFI